MSEQLAENLWRLEIPLEGNPLKDLNSYLLTGERNLLIDTGFNQKSCKTAMVKQLRELKVDLNKTDIFLTHVHYDHSGLSTFLHRPGCKIYISKIDGKIMAETRSEAVWRKRYERCIQNGFVEEETQLLWGSNPSQNRGPEPFEDYTYLQDGDVLEYAGVKLTCIATPGHTPGHLCLYNKENKWLFSGDHVLFRISPNICAWRNVEDSLSDYLASLQKISSLEVTGLFPGHRLLEGNLQERIKELQQHHAKRLQETLSAVKSNPGLTPYDIAGKMHWNIRARSWEDFPVNQKYFATGETVAHLDYLRVRGKLEVRLEKGKNRYY